MSLRSSNKNVVFFNYFLKINFLATFLVNFEFHLIIISDSICISQAFFQCRQALVNIYSPYYNQNKIFLYFIKKLNLMQQHYVLKLFLLFYFSLNLHTIEHLFHISEFWLGTIIFFFHIRVLTLHMPFVNRFGIIG